jgi:hypothetical protein
MRSHCASVRRSAARSQRRSTSGCAQADSIAPGSEATSAPGPRQCGGRIGWVKVESAPTSWALRRLSRADKAARWNEARRRRGASSPAGAVRCCRVPGLRVGDRDRQARTLGLVRASG